MREKQWQRPDLTWAVTMIMALSSAFSFAQVPSFECGYAVESGQDVRSFADAYLAAWNDRDEVSLRNFFARNIVYRDATYGQIHEGIEAVIDDFRQQIRAAPDLRRSVTDVICENPSRFVIRWLSWRSVDGKPLELEGVSILNLVGGRIVTTTDFTQVTR